MAVRDIIERLKPGEGEEKGPDFIEVQAEPEEQRINVKIDTLKDFSDTERIQKLVRNGSVVFLKIKDIRQRDITELKRCVDRLRKTCVAMNGDIVGIDEDFLVVTPSFARIYRGKAV